MQVRRLLRIMVFRLFILSVFLEVLMQEFLQGAGIVCIGSLIVAAYLIWCGIQTIYESLRGQNRDVK